jgi:hypothetical protein
MSETIHLRIKNRDPRPNFSAIHDINELLQAGDGVLRRLRHPLSVKRNASVSGDGARSSASAPALAPAPSPVQEVDEGPARKAKSGEEEALCYFQELHTEILSNVLRVGRCPEHDAYLSAR